ncbi:nanos-related protein [Plakobranchus ocellatus]|uniref:Nanos-related protein n=1 Tax=Plakobranchus ocellatus TaxID=259542 RepID=A0AAV4BZE0_9GAST|nr:nanos-related protein [Plakobranchus ocellatus]
MYTLFGPTTLWPHNSMTGNKQIIYSPYPTAYVVGPLAPQAVLSQNVQAAYSSTRQQLSAWSDTPAAAPVHDGYSNHHSRESSSSDEVFMPNNASSGQLVYAAPYALGYLAASSALNSGPQTPAPSHKFTVNSDMFMPLAPSIRLPEKYSKVRGKNGLTKASLKKNRRRSANGSLNSSGGTSGSSQNITGLSHNPNVTGHDLHLDNLSDVTPANTSGSGSDTSYSHFQSRHTEANSRADTMSVSSCVLPLSLRTALNEDPPEPSTDGAPLKTSSPIRENDEFLSLPTVIPTNMQKAVRETLKNLPPPIGAEISKLKKAAKEKDEDKENAVEKSKDRKRRDGRFITGAVKNVNKVSPQPSVEKMPRICTAEDDNDDMDQCDLILKKRQQMDAAEEQARRREEFLLILEAERERQRRLVLPKRAPKMNCKFCRNNGESEEVYSKHRLHENERTVCPILRHYVCRLCNSTGDFAHTIRHCPFNNRKDRMAWKATFMM